MFSPILKIDWLAKNILLFCMHWRKKQIVNQNWFNSFVHRIEILLVYDMLTQGKMLRSNHTLALCIISTNLIGLNESVLDAQRCPWSTNLVSRRPFIRVQLIWLTTTTYCQPLVNPQIEPRSVTISFTLDNLMEGWFTYVF